MEDASRVNRNYFLQWNMDSSPCQWIGIQCTQDGTRVYGFNMSGSNLSGKLFTNFSSLTALASLDLSHNTFSGIIPDDLSNCYNLVYLNLSHNTLTGELKLNSLANLEKLDLSENRFFGSINISFPAICSKLTVINLSVNNFTSSIGDVFYGCSMLVNLDLSSNKFSGEMWGGFTKLQMFSAADNFFTEELLGSYFTEPCNLHNLDLSGNKFTGPLPGEISNCRNLSLLNIWGNNFKGPIPPEIGSIQTLKAINLGNNNFDRDIPRSLLNLSNLVFLDMGKSNFRDDIQDIFGEFKQLKVLVLLGNSYTGGLQSSGILNLGNLTRLDLSNNSFSGSLPVEFSLMSNLAFLVLAHNNFTGSIPSAYGRLSNLQALDISFNKLTNQIPSSLGNLTNLLWLMLASNMLTGEIPPELGNCSSLLWLNLANNRLSGKIPPELMNIGKNPVSTFSKNQQSDSASASSGECLTMKRWIPADYPPFSFIYTILTRKTCKSIWDRLLKGYSLFPVCRRGSRQVKFQVSGYFQVSQNLLSGEVSENIGNMLDFSMVHLGNNKFHGKLPTEIGSLPLTVLNLTSNNFSGEIPDSIGSMTCLQNLDLSYNNFSGEFPQSLNNLYDLSKFNISFNPLISGSTPSSGQLATFTKESFLGDPLLKLPEFIKSSDTQHNETAEDQKEGKSMNVVVFVVIIAMCLVIAFSGAVTYILHLVTRSSKESVHLLGDSKVRHDTTNSQWLSETVQIIHFDNRAFTYSHIVTATDHFSETRVLGKGGFGTVYRGVLPDGREIAVKKLQRRGIDGEKDFHAEMEVLRGNGSGWPHPNLVTLYGWCLHDTEKILVYEFVGGGTLEELISDMVKLTWRRRIDIAIDVARALAFLHHERYPAIVHRDVKASNVLLDEVGTAKITDFGLARFLETDGSHVSTIVAGTVGYVAPEYSQTWQATTKGDVYSFGVMVMELATGRRAIDGGEECLVDWARRVIGMRIRDGPIPEAVLEPGLGEGDQEMVALLKIGIRCASEAPQGRPNMKEVVAMLMNISPNKETATFSP